MPLVILIHPIIPEPDKLLDMGISVALTVAAAFLMWQLAFVIVGRIEKWMARAAGHSEGGEQRARTLGQIFRNLAVVFIVSGALIHVLDVFGWDVKPLLAGAGILGVALGFGAQTLVRDVIAGFFILVENQFSVGDLIEVNGNAATVEDLSVRCTRLRDFNGFVHFVPNGEMKIVTNRSRGWSRIAVDMPVAAEEDIDRALGVCRAVVTTMNADPAWKARLLEPIDLWGVESLTGSENTIRSVIRARPGADGPQSARELKRRLLVAMGEQGIGTRTTREIFVSALPGQAEERLGAPARRA
ncbi:MAG TPA: mechanosensitive ion channel family protein [Candidatus Eisenbacteria bacterium]